MFLTFRNFPPSLKVILQIYTLSNLSEGKKSNQTRCNCSCLYDTVKQVTFSKRPAKGNQLENFISTIYIGEWPHQPYSKALGLDLNWRDEALFFFQTKRRQTSQMSKTNWEKHSKLTFLKTSLIFGSFARPSKAIIHVVKFVNSYA